jgi:hypothetical protein
MLNKNLPDDEPDDFEKHLAAIGLPQQAEAHRAERVAAAESAAALAEEARADVERERRSVQLRHWVEHDLFGCRRNGAPPLLSDEVIKQIHDAVKEKHGRPAFRDRPTVYCADGASVAAMLRPIYRDIFLERAVDADDAADPVRWGTDALLDGVVIGLGGEIEAEMNRALQSIGWIRSEHRGGGLVPPKAGKKSEAVKADDLDERILAFIRSSDGPVKRGDIYEAIGGRRADVVEALDALIASGRLVETKVKNAKLVAIADDDDDD